MLRMSMSRRQLNPSGDETPRALLARRRRDRRHAAFHPTPLQLRRSEHLPRSEFLEVWIDSLDELLLAWLMSSVAREATERACDEPLLSVEASAVEVLAEAVADAHGLSLAELRALVPSIDEECTRFVRRHRVAFRRG